MDQELLFARNKGLLSAQDQDKLAHTSVLIAGVGGDGGLLAERLVRSGIGKIILADPEVFECENGNRQYAANINNTGINKAKAVADELILINPDVEIVVCMEGITKDNVLQLVMQADIIIDEVEYTLPSISVMLHKAARQQEKYIFMGANIGWGASIFCFSPHGKTFEEHFNYNEKDVTINPLAYLKERPSYISDHLAEQILSRSIPMPTVASSVSLVASVLTCEIIHFISGKKEPLIVPQFITVDLFDLTINKS
ncbi:MAG: ThiF family adenylyltransferase [Taibaiella sp.]|nr:ThiF family adenylyltransferase [Taibaiella sp.]